MRFCILIIFIAFVCAVAEGLKFCPVETVIVDGKKESREVCD
jgi:hypothetical protein